MLKIFMMQFVGIFFCIQDKEFEVIEDGVWLLVQAVVSGYFIYLYGVNEMQGILCEVEFGFELMFVVKVFLDIVDLIIESDRVLMFCLSLGMVEEQVLV